MTAISERVALGHRAYPVLGCSCGDRWPGDSPLNFHIWHLTHVGDLVEAATRESIELKLRDLVTTRTQAFLMGWDSISLNDAIDCTR